MMKLQFKAFQFSLLIHLLIVSLVIIAGNVLSSEIKKLVMISFDVEHIQEEAPPTLPKPEPVRKVAVRKAVAPVAPVAQTQPEKPMEEITRPAPGPTEAVLPVALPEKPVLAATSGPVAISGGDGNGDASPEAAKNKYLREHFTYIRDKVLKNVTYPPVALRMGWQGKVVVNFLILPDGSVRDVSVAKSSGVRILDRDAVETVEHTAPFTKPPVAAQITIPIVYHLTD